MSRLIWSRISHLESSLPAGEGGGRGHYVESYPEKLFWEHCLHGCRHIRQHTHYIRLTCRQALHLLAQQFILFSFHLFFHIYNFYFSLQGGARGRLSFPSLQGGARGMLPPPLGRAGVGLYRSALIGLFRKSSYANRMPSSSSVLYVHPSFVAFDTSSNFRGVPFGRVVSQRMAPS